MSSQTPRQPPGDRAAQTDSVEPLMREVAHSPAIAPPVELGPGTHLGPYELGAPVGAGGMGEVYRARDTRLGREVAVKVLRPPFRSDPERLRRFEQEARSAAAVEHPSVLAVHDVGTEQGVFYVVTELLEGVTLRELLREGPPPRRQALDYALQAAHGLGAAHDRGIVHRDLKPENLFVTRQGRLKILDFGLAKCSQVSIPGGDRQAHTDAGTVLGTAPYMSPEQARGEVVDHRTDLFSFGAILYELLVGRPAFAASSGAQTLSAILTQDPAELPSLPPGLQSLVRRCLERDRAARFQSARDLAFALEALGEVTASGILPRSKSCTCFRRLTFRRGTIWNARFTPDGHTVVYTACFDGEPPDVYVMRPEAPESQSLGFSGSRLLAVSSLGQLALSLDDRQVSWSEREGTLARSPMLGGAPRRVADHVRAADWSADGTQLAAVCARDGSQRLEYPQGRSLVDVVGWISHPRISPSGDQVAFINHPTPGDDGGCVEVVDRAGTSRVLSSGWTSLQGLAWSPYGEEVWFTGARGGGLRALYAVDPSGQERLVGEFPAIMTLLDISADGRLLMISHQSRTALRSLAPGEEHERDLSWLDWSVVIDLSDDGRSVVFCESGQGGGPSYSGYRRTTDGAPPVHLVSAAPFAVSPDGSWLVAGEPPTFSRLTLHPTGTGEPRTLRDSGLRLRSAAFLPDGQRILLAGVEPGRAPRLYLTDLQASPVRPIGEEGLGFPWTTKPPSPDGRWVAARRGDGVTFLVSLVGEPTRALEGLGGDDIALRWSSDAQRLLVYRQGEVPARVYAYDPISGEKTLLRELPLADPAGVVAVRPPKLTADGSGYAYSYTQLLGDLYLVTDVE